MDSHVSTNPVSRSGRFRLAIDDMEFYSTHPAFGASQNKSEKTPRDAIDSSIPTSSRTQRRNLIARLKADESVIWQSLLDNTFCNKMKTTRTTDSTYQDVVKGFKWYMVQDFLYLARVMLYDTERSTGAPDEATYEALNRRIGSNAAYSLAILKTCIHSLGISESNVLHAKREDATKKYIDFIVDIAERYDWVVSLLAIVPCIQSYYQIAVNIEAYPSVDKNTIWYKYWVEENVKYGASVERQIQFFRTHAAVWQKIEYSKLREIFREGCQREIELWSVGLNPGKVD
ncbi:hypothetical protein BC826DRAFT_1001042 [Russula brevipes]|nr:hypothetical protein BC826DRAFT_1001042 [Russula brevipes]